MTVTHGSIAATVEPVGVGASIAGPATPVIPARGSNNMATKTPRCPTATETEIAKKVIPWVPTLDSRGRDALDFYDIGVATLRTLIDEAYQRGYQDGRADHIIETQPDPKLLNSGQGWELWDRMPPAAYLEHVDLITEDDKGVLLEWWY